MAPRKQLWHPDDVRKRIQASQLINRLTEHVNSKTPLMDSSQVTAAVKLLGKVLPDLSATQLSGDDDHPVKLVVEWQSKE
jgi:hypothetical protein